MSYMHSLGRHNLVYNIYQIPIVNLYTYVNTIGFLVYVTTTFYFIYNLIQTRYTNLYVYMCFVIYVLNTLYHLYLHDRFTHINSNTSV